MERREWIDFALHAEEGLEDGHFVLIPDNDEEHQNIPGGNRQFKLVIWGTSTRKKPPTTKQPTDWNEFHGRTINFKNGNCPSNQMLFLHFLLTFLRKTRHFPLAQVENDMPQEVLNEAKPTKHSQGNQPADKSEASSNPRPPPSQPTVWPTSAGRLLHWRMLEPLGQVFGRVGREDMLRLFQPYCADFWPLDGSNIGWMREHEWLMVQELLARDVLPENSRDADEEQEESSMGGLNEASGL